MYQKYADTQGWKVSLMSESSAEAGGYKECVLQITGDRQVGPGLPPAGEVASAALWAPWSCCCRRWARLGAARRSALGCTRRWWHHPTVPLPYILYRPYRPCSVYSKLKYESGVHRVQRVPATETSGRVHTSTATVAIMPEVDDVAVKIDPKVGSLLGWLRGSQVATPRGAGTRRHAGWWAGLLRLYSYSRLRMRAHPTPPTGHRMPPRRTSH